MYSSLIFLLSVWYIEYLNTMPIRFFIIFDNLKKNICIQNCNIQNNIDSENKKSIYLYIYSFITHIIFIKTNIYW